MKPKPLQRFIFSLVVCTCCIVFLYGAKNIANENYLIQKKYGTTGSLQRPAPSLELTSNDFIFFEAVTKYIFTSLRH